MTPSTFKVRWLRKTRVSGWPGAGRGGENASWNEGRERGGGESGGGEREVGEREREMGGGRERERERERDQQSLPPGILGCHLDGCLLTTGEEIWWELEGYLKNLLRAFTQHLCMLGRRGEDWMRSIMYFIHCRNRTVPV